MHEVMWLFSPNILYLQFSIELLNSHIGGNDYLECGWHNGLYIDHVSFSAIRQTLAGSVYIYSLRTDIMYEETLHLKCAAVCLASSMFTL